MEQKLGLLRRLVVPGRDRCGWLARLSGGASQETWSFDIVYPNGNIGAILRRAPVGYGAAPTRAAGLNAEATLMQLAHDAGLPSPRVLHVLQPQDELGTGFIMARVEGETIARKILRDDQFAEARPILARQLGKVVAGIHGCPRRNCQNFGRGRRQKRLPIWSGNIAASIGRGRCSNWRCSGCATTTPVRPTR